jgi:hypothetical protein
MPCMDATVCISDVFKGSPFAVRSCVHGLPVTPKVGPSEVWRFSHSPHPEAPFAEGKGLEEAGVSEAKRRLQRGRKARGGDEPLWSGATWQLRLPRKR